MLHVGCDHLIAESAPCRRLSMTARACDAASRKAGGIAAMYSSTVAYFATHHRRLQNLRFESRDLAGANRKAVAPARGPGKDRRVTRPRRLDDLADDVDTLDFDDKLGRRLLARCAHPRGDRVASFERLPAKRLLVDRVVREQREQLVLALGASLHRVEVRLNRLIHASS